MNPVVACTLIGAGIGLLAGLQINRSANFEAGRAQGWNDCYFKQVERENARRERDRRFKHARQPAAK